MTEKRTLQRARTLRGGKIVLNDKGSVLDCTVRNLTSEGACLLVNNPVSVPPAFDLLLDNEPLRRCRLIWSASDRIGVSFLNATSAPLHHSDRQHSSETPHDLRSNAAPPGNDLVRGELLRLRAALDQVKVGIVLLDGELRARFINRAFRQMWRLPDTKADANPAFVALMYHGRDTLAYEIPNAELDTYVEERVAEVRAGKSTPRDIRLRSGEVIRFQCVTLPDGGRMLSYTYVTDIVRHSDELDALRAALDKVEQGVLLLDAQLNVRFMNRIVRRLWGVSNELIERKPSYAELLGDSQLTKVYGIPATELGSFVAERLASVRRGDPAPQLIRLKNDRTIRVQCAVLPDQGRLLTYTDVTDFVRNAEELERLATTDSLTLCCNRRQFWTLAENEWIRFQRYHRPLSMMMFDIDHFKWINDRCGHEAGDHVLTHIGEICRSIKRTSDVVGRLGGDEFAILLPETDLAQTLVVAERLRDAIQASPVAIGQHTLSVRLSIGVAQATLSQSGAMALLKRADEALYSAKKAGRNQIAVATDDPFDNKAAAE